MAYEAQKALEYKIKSFLYIWNCTV